MTSNGGFNSTNHTNTNVPVFAIGPGTEMFKGTTVDNTDIAKFLAAAFTEAKFGDQSLGKK
jgi:alkaline phosphatase